MGGANNEHGIEWAWSPRNMLSLDKLFAVDYV